MKVSWDKWDGVYNVGSETEISSFSEIENLIRRLNQSTYDQVILNGEKNTFQGIIDLKMENNPELSLEDTDVFIEAILYYLENDDFLD